MRKQGVGKLFDINFSHQLSAFPSSFPSFLYFSLYLFAYLLYLFILLLSEFWIRMRKHRRIFFYVINFFHQSFSFFLSLLYLLLLLLSELGYKWQNTASENYLSLIYLIKKLYAFPLPLFWLSAHALIISLACVDWFCYRLIFYSLFSLFQASSHT